MKGVIRTRVGYSGGTKEAPTYYRLGDHTESVQVDYDPAQISYQELLDVFWKSHYTTVPVTSRQYMSVIFYHNEEQKRLVLESKERLEAELKSEVYTEILPASEFYIAKDYHQKYYLQNTTFLMKEFKAMYPNLNDFVNSTAAARVNGYIAGYGTSANLLEELDSLGLSPAGKQRLRDIFHLDEGSEGCPVPPIENS